MKIYSIEIVWTFTGSKMGFDFHEIVLAFPYCGKCPENPRILAKSIPLNHQQIHKMEDITRVGIFNFFSAQTNGGTAS